MVATETSRPDPLANLPRQDRHVPKCGPVATSKMTRWRAAALIGVHVLIGLHVWYWLSTGRAITPVEPSEAMQTVEQGRINAGFVLFAALIGSTLVFGRFFCGWACHVVALQDLSAWLLARVGLKPRPVRSRLLVFAPWVVAFVMFGWPVVQQWLGERQLPSPSDWEWALTTDDLWKTFPGPIMAIGTVVVVGFLIVWWLGAKGFCTYGCPYGAFFAVADRFAPTRIKVTDACDACGHCTNVCTSNVRVHEEVARHRQIVDPGCMKCLDCVSVCPKDALYVGFAAPKPFVLSQQRITARGDFTWPEEVLLAAVAIVATQWTFRGAWFGEGVPFLMAVGLGVITAVLALLFVRLLLRAELTFQHTPLRAAGKLTRAGRFTLVLLAAWLAFAAHTFVGQRLSNSAKEGAAVVLRERLNERKDVAPERLQTAHDAVDGALAWDLVDDPGLLQARGLLRRELGRHDEAEADLRAALGKLPGLEYAGVALAIYRLRAQDFDQAEQLAKAVLAEHPDNPTARAILEQLANRPR
ncbi:MAG: 4Fe-4S binding protein [Planctomycetes bacterium]|nr:4Fe-4S binding protein [Planctomycetota bacterium]